MKKLITFIFLLHAINCYSQITTINTKEKGELVEVQKYDSLESLNIENALSHKGQTIFLKGTNYTKENDFHYTFYTEFVRDISSKKNTHTSLPPEKGKEK